MNNVSKVKPRVECTPPELVQVRPGVYVARLEHHLNHPVLGSGGRMQTSMVLRVDFERRELETLNTIYWWK